MNVYITFPFVGEYVKLFQIFWLTLFLFLSILSFILLFDMSKRIQYFYFEQLPLPSIAIYDNATNPHTHTQILKWAARMKTEKVFELQYTFYLLHLLQKLVKYNRNFSYHLCLAISVCVWVCAFLCAYVCLYVCVFVRTLSRRTIV